MTSGRVNRWHRINRAVLAAELARLKSILDGYENGQQAVRAAVPRSRARRSRTPPAIDHVCQAFALGEFERDVLLLCAGVEADAALAESCARAQGNAQWTRPTVGLVLAALPHATWHALSPQATLRSMDLVQLDRAVEFVRAPISLDEAMLHYVLDGDYCDPELDGVAEPLSVEPHGVAEHAAAVARGLEYWKTAPGRLPVLNFSARDTGDGLSAAALLCREAGCTGWRIDAGTLPAQPGALRKTVRHWRRLSRLFDAAAAIVIPSEAGNEVAETAFRFASAAGGLVMVIGREWHDGTPRGGVVPIEIPPAGAASRRKLWQQALGEALDAAPAREAVDALADTFELDIASLQTAAGVAAGKHWLPEVWDACRQRARVQLDRSAQRIKVHTGWDGLVVPEPLEKALRDLGAQMHHRTLVYEKWGLGAAGGRGLGIAALFTGPSGTGKTLAAEVLAGELNLDLYRIDLASVVSKYIGETEKNLARIFDAAEAGGAVLLFDEADALFGKRSEVKDSHDRYANIEVGYLLQRMETYRGLALLTTNFRDSLDQAFLRRLRFVLEFPFPDADLRARLWRVALPASVPQHGVDAAALARLPLAGGQIRTVALNAAFLAAADGGVLKPGHLQTAVEREYAKTGRALTDSERKIFDEPKADGGAHAQTHDARHRHAAPSGLGAP